MGDDRQTPPVVLFDGVCNLCNGAVQFIIDRDPQSQFRFASLQSETGHTLLASHHYRLPEGDPETLVLVEGGVVYERSTAALKIARRLRGGWKLFAALLVLPRGLRDVGYNFIARHRYGWFGKTESCRLPTPELRARFLA
jgi:predicted DCC family thiol-disulfide oxidoreductase YuxK